MENTNNSATVYLHPIVALTISDQWTRRKMNSDDVHPKVIGYLTGKKDDLRLEVNRAFLLIFDERKMDDDLNALSFDEEFFKTQLELSKEMYPDEELLGWFTNGTHVKVTQVEEHLNRQFMKHNDCPLLLKFDTEHLQSTGRLNIGCFETVTDEADKSKTSFRLLPLHFETEASELIGLEHMASFSSSADYSHTSASKVLTSLTVSMEVFHHRLRVCREYIKDVMKGEIQSDPQVLSDIFKLCLRLKALKTHSSIDNQNLVTTSKQILNIAGLTALYEDVSSVSEILNNFFTESSAPSASHYRRLPAGLH
uniref:COP9 signalosome complex subunit 6 n=1 Tax=Panagrolaimus superbus TaxID=310955 RepID=A0A914ZHB3_9BILA